MYSKDFHKWYEKNRIWENTKWLGVSMWKLPMDSFVIQDIIMEVRPDYVIETGTGKGGSSVFYASIMELLQHGQVITVDVDPSKFQFDKCPNTNITDRIMTVEGSSIYKNVYNAIRAFVSGHINLVILDSWHSYEHVLEEMNLYSKFVSLGSYMVVEDSHVNSHPVPWKWGKGPYEAVEEFLKENNDRFKYDDSKEYHGMTFNPRGFLRRVK